MLEQLELFGKTPKQFKTSLKEARKRVEIFAGFYPRATEYVNIKYRITDDILAMWSANESERYLNYIQYVKKYAQAHNIH